MDNEAADSDFMHPFRLPYKFLFVELVVPAPKRNTLII